MKVTQALPTPSSSAIAHSEKLLQRIHDEITQHSGAISFRRFMEMSLYEPALGYYVAGQRKLGADGDFVTAPEISPLFSQCVANQCAQVLQLLEDEDTPGDILELGAGSGAMACELLLHLEKIGCLPDRYFILDLSPDLQALQRATFEQRAAHLLPHVQWLNSLEDTHFSGVILANEVLDAMPVERFRLRDGAIFQDQVGWQNNQLAIQPAPASPAVKAFVDGLGISSSEIYISEYNLAIDSWITQLSGCLQQGVMLLVDYGYTRQEYYHPQRNEGTLICHYQHLVHNDFFWHPGLQDITANVDFTHVAAAAHKNALKISGFTTQAAFLAGCGLEALFMQALTDCPDQQYPLAQQVRTLSLPSEMGERFKVIALNKGINADLIGFSLIDYKHKL